ncbi:MAG: hypothetical protein K0S80_5343, partial [Neobacillus sp.]|nr:hypothetical protein [Neobacillus sp.]
SRTVMETSIIGMPVLVVFGMGSMLKAMVENETILKIIDYLPNEQLNTIWFGLGNGKGFSEIIENILVLFVWVAVSIVITVVIYRKRRFD